jgi:hypothetical protein
LNFTLWRSLRELLHQKIHQVDFSRQKALMGSQKALMSSQKALTSYHFGVFRRQKALTSS